MRWGDRMEKVTVIYYFNTWDDSDIDHMVENVTADCEDFEIHHAFSELLSLQGIIVHDWAIDRLTLEEMVSMDNADIIKRGEKLFHEQND